jgi:hypothetical protein
MLRKGAVVLLLVRPLHRFRLLLFIYLGGITYILVNFAVLVTALWLVLGLRSGLWRPGVLLSIPVMTFFFAILYSVSVFYGVLTRSPVVCILVTCITWFGFWLVGFLYAEIEPTRQMQAYPAWVYPVLDTLHAVLPRTQDLNLLMTKVLSHEFLDATEMRMHGVANLPGLAWGEALAISLGFIALHLGLSCWRFSAKDY